MSSPAWNPSNSYVALTLGTETWCASAWHDIYYRAFRLGGDPLARPLVSGEENANIGDDPPIHGSVTTDDVLIQYNGHSIDSGILVRQHVRHYRIDGPKAKRVNPLALRPRDFVDEWLTREWTEAAFWAESADRVGSPGTPPKLVLFAVRWRPSYKFSMVQVSDTPSAACSQEDREADEGPQTLFP